MLDRAYDCLIYCIAVIIIDINIDMLCYCILIFVNAC